MQTADNKDHQMTDLADDAANETLHTCQVCTERAFNFDIARMDQAIRSPRHPMPHFSDEAAFF